MSADVALMTSASAPLAHPPAGGALAPPRPPPLTRDQVDLLKVTIAKGASDDELKLFVATADRLGLDPFARQICFVKRKSKKTGNEEGSIQVQIDGFRLVAERTGCYVPGRRSEFEYDAQGYLIRALAFVQKFSHGGWHEVSEEASWSEFAQETPPWTRMPRVMLSKCAEARALRRAFPYELSGVYAPEELGQVAEVVPVPDTKALLQLIESAATLLDLAKLVDELSRVPKGGAGSTYAKLRKAYGDRKTMLEKRAATAPVEKVGPEEVLEPEVEPLPDAGALQRNDLPPDDDEIAW